MLILHYTGMRSAAEAIARLRDPASRVSSHYVVDEDGSVLRLVPEARRAWHAGVSCWRGKRMLNDCSVGIEIVNPGHEWGYRPFPAAQMRSVAALCLEILGRHAIPPHHVVGHSDVAPDRKQDPGELFDWQGLAGQGIGLWPLPYPSPAFREREEPSCAARLRHDAKRWEGEGRAALIESDPIAAARALAAIGYDPEAALGVVLPAFQRHWFPQALGRPLDPATARRIEEIRAAMPLP